MQLHNFVLNCLYSYLNFLNETESSLLHNILFLYGKSFDSLFYCVNCNKFGGGHSGRIDKGKALLVSPTEM